MPLRFFGSRRSAEKYVEMLYLDGDLNFEDSAEVIERGSGRNRRFSIIVG